MTRYIGRFAPSPTGPLHFGSLVAATASFLDARAQQGHWLLRIEDLDPPREQAGATQHIVQTLQSHGLQWDGEILYQSQRHSTYAAAVQALLDAGQAFLCNCTRSQLHDSGGIYPGTCRSRQPKHAENCAVRVNVAHEAVTFVDTVQGSIQQDLASEVGDFIIRRRDGLYAYQLAVVVDDAFQGITHIVRGADLLDSTPRQIHLQHQLGLPTPHYTHVPVAGNRQGQKLSKQTHATALNDTDAVANLLAVLDFLGQPAPPAAQRHDPASLLRWSANHWRPQQIPRQRLIPIC